MGEKPFFRASLYHVCWLGISQYEVFLLCYLCAKFLADLFGFGLLAFHFLLSFFLSCCFSSAAAAAFCWPHKKNSNFSCLSHFFLYMCHKNCRQCPLSMSLQRDSVFVFMSLCVNKSSDAMDGIFCSPKFHFSINFNKRKMEWNEMSRLKSCVIISKYVRYVSFQILCTKQAHGE